MVMSLHVYTYANSNLLGVPLNEEQLKITFENKQVEMLLGDIVLLPENNTYDQTSAQEMILRLSKIDPVILTFLAQNDLKIKLFDGKLTDEPNFQYLSGTVPRGWNNGLTWDDVPGGCGPTLAVAKIGASNTGMGHSSINLELHELGHLFERNYQDLTNNAAYDQIWKEEAPKLMPNRQYFLDYQDEFFAEAFAMYYLSENSRNTLKQNAPNTFSFLENIEDEGYLI